LHKGKGGKEKGLGAGRQEMVVPVREEWIFLLRWIWRQYVLTQCWYISPDYTAYMVVRNNFCIYCHHDLISHVLKRKWQCNDSVSGKILFMVSSLNSERSPIF